MRETLERSHALHLTSSPMLRLSGIYLQHPCIPRGLGRCGRLAIWLRLYFVQPLDDRALAGRLPVDVRWRRVARNGKWRAICWCFALRKNGAAFKSSVFWLVFLIAADGGRLFWHSACAGAVQPRISTHEK